MTGKGGEGKATSRRVKYTGTKGEIKKAKR